MTTADTTQAQDADQASGHDDAHHHEKPRWDDINVGSIVVSGFVSAVLTYAIICGCQAFYYYCQNRELYVKEYEIRQTPQTATIAKQKESLTRYAKADDGNIVIPINRAMELVVDEYKK